MSYLHEPEFPEEEWNVVVVDDMKADKEKENQLTTWPQPWLFI